MFDPQTCLTPHASVAPFFFCVKRALLLGSGVAVSETRATDAYPHKLRLICLWLYRHGRAVRYIVQAFVRSVIESLPGVVFPGIVRHLIVRLKCMMLVQDVQILTARACAETANLASSQFFASAKIRVICWRAYRAGPDVRRLFRNVRGTRHLVCLQMIRRTLATCNAMHRRATITHDGNACLDKSKTLTFESQHKSRWCDSTSVADWSSSDSIRICFLQLVPV